MGGLFCYVLLFDPANFETAWVPAASAARWTAPTPHSFGVCEQNDLLKWPFGSSSMDWFKLVHSQLLAPRRCDKNVGYYIYIYIYVVAQYISM